MKICIHRGTNEIGGSCVELCSAGSRIIIDIGMPLTNKDGSEFDYKKYYGMDIDQLIQMKVLPDINGLYKSSEQKVNGLLISHAHQDHFGLMNHIDSSVPIYLGAATESLLKINSIFTRTKYNLQSVVRFEKESPFTIGDFTITPYWADHSAFDSYSFLIEAQEKVIFYSGDFRGHGRKSKVFDWFLHNAPKNVDYLLLEGTTIGSSIHKCYSEIYVETKISDILRANNKPILVYVSGQNIDRLVSIYKACLRNNKKMVIDVYIASVLHEMAKYGKIPYPSKSFPLLKVNYSRTACSILEKNGRKDIMYQFKTYKITRDDLDKELNNSVLLVRPSMQRELAKFQNLQNGILIYSMWEGYAEKDYTKKFLDYLKNRGFTIESIHTSGHADIPTLKKMVEAIKPKAIIPIHTSQKDIYQQIFDIPISKLSDGEMLEI